SLAEGLAGAEARAPELVTSQRERLLERVNEFLAGRGLSIEPDNVVRELAVFAEKTDVAEEIQRLRAHIERAHQLLDGGGEVGRRFEFLVQEMLRETNTLGSKSPDVQIAHTVVAMKTAIDRLKEQAANLE
ncbi:MAG: endoribonuclease YicC domain-containing protein, partial [Planctomycetota bacterium]